MTMYTVRRMAADILKVGQSRIKIQPAEQKAAEDALTRDDVRGLIDKGSIYALEKQGVPRTRGRAKHIQKSLGRRRGIGSRKGKKYSKVPRKEIWMNRVRAQRALLRELLDKGRIEQSTYRPMYYMVKGGAFKGRNSMLMHLKDAGLLKEAAKK